MLYHPTDSSHIGLLVHPYCTQFYPQPPKQLSSAIQPGRATLVNGIQCPLRDKILLCPSVSSKTSTGKIKDGGLEGTPQLFRTSQSTQTPQISTQLVRKLLSYPLILELAYIQPGWDDTILLDLSCNLRVSTTSRWSVLRNCALRWTLQFWIILQRPSTSTRPISFATPPALEY